MLCLNSILVYSSSCKYILSPSKHSKQKYDEIIQSHKHDKAINILRTFKKIVWISVRERNANENISRQISVSCYMQT